MAVSTKKLKTENFPVRPARPGPEILTAISNFSLCTIIRVIQWEMSNGLHSTRWKKKIFSSNLRPIKHQIFILEVNCPIIKINNFYSFLLKAYGGPGGVFFTTVPWPEWLATCGSWYSLQLYRSFFVRKNTCGLSLLLLFYYIILETWQREIWAIFRISIV